MVTGYQNKIWTLIYLIRENFYIMNLITLMNKTREEIEKRYLVLKRTFL